MAEVQHDGILQPDRKPSGNSPNQKLEISTDTRCLLTALSGNIRFEQFAVNELTSMKTLYYMVDFLPLSAKPSFLSTNPRSLLIYFHTTAI